MCISVREQPSLTVVLEGETKSGRERVVLFVHNKMQFCGKNMDKICRFYPCVYCIYLFGLCRYDFWLFCCCKTFEITEIILQSDMVM